MQQPLESGACLDSPRQVPKALEKPVSRAIRLVRIDEVLSTATMTPGEIIGFLYTTSDGRSWLGERSSHFMSPANATEINAVLPSTRAAGVAANGLPAAEPLRVSDEVSADLRGPHSARCDGRPADHAGAVHRLAEPTPASRPKHVSVRRRL